MHILTIALLIYLLVDWSLNLSNRPTGRNETYE